MKELLPISEMEQIAPIFRGKAGNSFARSLKRFLKVELLEKYVDEYSSYKGLDFAKKALEVLGMNYTLNGLKREDAMDFLHGVLPEGPFITISNHTMGALDGISLIDLIGHVREDYKFMVNQILWRFEMMRDHLICVNPNGNMLSTPTAQSITGVREAMQHLSGGHSLGLFPSGAVSDLKLGRRPVVEIPGQAAYTEPRIRDREWQSSIIRFIRKMEVPILPIRLLNGNSRFYYNLGLIDWRVRLLRLPREVLNKEGFTLRLTAGPLITPDQLKQFTNIPTLRRYLRAKVYSL